MVSFCCLCCTAQVSELVAARSYTFEVGLAGGNAFNGDGFEKVLPMCVMV
ncbi:hypothetical protein CFELI_07760 [Corynebacterium felinum]|uniref:Uncharacterized protein n=1 Tax=Corynebacterium felinum TaxID=131318 RepID=A0ABU2BBS2_9CORY|nr:hypothetical protein [Corynebacterium felinum]WJY95166.1 hypothetical protein CFELI_07760 [Corynebacterium felinum]